MASTTARRAALVGASAALGGAAWYLARSPSAAPPGQQGEHSRLNELTSRTIGFMDYAIFCLRLVPGRPRFFGRGWGDIAGANARQTELANCVARGVELPTMPELRAALRWEETPDPCVFKGTFASPMAAALPEVAKVCIFKQTRFPKPTKVADRDSQQKWRTAKS